MFGSVQPESGSSDIFVHISALQTSSVRSRKKEQKDSFDLEPALRGKGPKAMSIRDGICVTYRRGGVRDRRAPAVWESWIRNPRRLQPCRKRPSSLNDIGALRLSIQVKYFTKYTGLVPMSTSSITPTSDEGRRRIFSDDGGRRRRVLRDRRRNRRPDSAVQAGSDWHWTA